MSGKGLGRRAALLAGALAMWLPTCAGLSADQSQGPSRPRYIFINETQHHEHDLAFKMSLKLAEKRSRVENALVFLQRLPPGATIEQLAVDLFDRWQIGRSRAGKGILYVYSEAENLFKIEVSYELEGVFPDVLCRRLEEAAQTYMLSEVPQDFISELLITMNLKAAGESTGTDELSSRPPWLTQGFLSGGAGVTSKVYSRTLEDYAAAVRRLPTASVKGFQPSPDPSQTVQRYLESLDRGLGDPHMPLLTSGSQIFRALVPRNAAQQHRVFSYFQKALPYQVFTAGGLGLVVFQPGVPNLPIVLRQGQDGLWYVDEPKSWTYFHRYEDGIDFFPKFDDLPLLGALRQTRQPNADHPIYKRRVRTPEVPPYPVSLEKTVAQLEQRIRNDPTDAQLYATLGDVYFFEMNWLSRTLDAYQTAARLAPDRLEYRWRLVDLYLNTSQAEKFVEELRFLAHRLPNDAEAQRWYKFYKHAYDFEPGEFLIAQQGGPAAR
jgi:TPM domain